MSAEAGTGDLQYAPGYLRRVRWIGSVLISLAVISLIKLVAAPAGDPAWLTGLHIANLCCNVLAAMVILAAAEAMARRPLARLVGGTLTVRTVLGQRELPVSGLRLVEGRRRWEFRSRHGERVVIRAHLVVPAEMACWLDALRSQGAITVASG